jgi:DNA-binding IclR family transcriptional regulator
VARALQVLDAFRHGDEPIGNSELADRTGLPKPTVSRLTYTLAQCGYLTYDTKRREYELGGGALAVGAAALSRRNVRSVARPLMRQLAAESGFNVGLGTHDHDQRMIYTDACEGPSLIGLRLQAGDRIPLLTTAMGRAWLAGLEADARNELLATQRADVPALVKTIEDAVRDVRRRGFCISAGDWQKDIHGVAAPICVGDRVFALNLGGPAYRLPMSSMNEELGPRIAAIAQRIEAALRGKST